MAVVAELQRQVTGVFIDVRCRIVFSMVNSERSSHSDRVIGSRVNYEAVPQKNPARRLLPKARSVGTGVTR